MKSCTRRWKNSGGVSRLCSRRFTKRPYRLWMRKPSEIPSRTQSVSAFLHDQVSVGPRFSGKVRSESRHSAMGSE